MGRVFPLIRLRASGSTSICSLPLGPVAMFFLDVNELSTGGTSCPVMSSCGKSPSCSSRSPRSHMFHDVFVCRLLIVVKRLHLGSCTLDYGTAVGYLNCGRRVADDHARVPKSVCWFLGCIRSTSPKPEELSNMQFSLIVFRCVDLISIDVFGPRLDLPPIILSAAGSLCLGLLLHTPKRHLPSVEGSCRRHVGTRCIRCRCFLMLWLGSQRRSPLQNPSTSVLRGRLVSSCSNLPSSPCLHVLSGHFSTGLPVVSLQVWSHRFQLSQQKPLDTGCDL